MPDTFQAVAVIIVALLPGALYVWSFERLVGSWGIGLSDRVLRFVGVSAVFHAMVAPLTVFLWRNYIATGRFAAGRLPLWMWLVPLAYVGLPIACGSIVGTATLARRDWVRALTGPAPAPRAWDDLFGSRPEGWIRLRMKSGVWIGGAFTNDRTANIRSYAAGYPYDQDLYLAVAADVDPSSGEFQFREDGRPVTKGTSILVRWEEVEYLEFAEER